MCQICKASDHIATTCPRIRNLKLKCVKCGLPYKMENCGIKCGYCARMGHMKDKWWKRGKDGKTLFVAVNYLEIMLVDEKIP